MFKVNNKELLERSSGVLILNFEQISHLFLMLLMFALNRKMFVEQFFLMQILLPKV